MDRLRRSFRDSFKRSKDHAVPESSKPHQWQLDEAAVRAGTCSFHVKYMGCVEVFESRGMQVCEEALKVLRNSRRRRVRAILYVSGDGLRVVEDETKGLIVDQTIEKVSFCAPDRNHDKGFSYICRDGTTRRWMCHGFLALRESGERLSHAVGCAFAACLERKQRRDKDFGVTMKFDTKNSTFTRSGSFRQPSLTERLADPQELKPAVPFPWEVARPSPAEIAAMPIAPVEPPDSIDPLDLCLGLGSNPLGSTAPAGPAAQAPAPAPAPVMAPALPGPPAEPVAPGTEPVPPAPAHKVGTNPYAIERPHATVSMLQRQGSFRGFTQLSQASPFKRQLSLRIGDLPSNLERQRSLSLEPQSSMRPPQAGGAAALTLAQPPQPAQPAQPAHGPPPVPGRRQRLMSLPNTSPAVCGNMSPIPEASPLANRSAAPVTTHSPAPAPPPMVAQDPVSAMCQQLSQGLLLLSSSDDFSLDTLTANNNNNNSLNSANGLWTGPTSCPAPAPAADPLAWTSTTLWPRSDTSAPTPTPTPAPSAVAPAPPETALPTVVPVPVKDLPRPEQWLGKISTVVNPAAAAPAPSPSPRKPPMLSSHARAYSLGSAESFMGRMNANGHHPTDPFDADWASLGLAGPGTAPGAVSNQVPAPAPAPASSTNPFLGSAVKAFEVRM